MKKKENKVYVRVYRYFYQNRMGIVGLDKKTMEKLFPIADIEGVGGPFYCELSAKQVKQEDIPVHITITRIK